MNGLDLFSGYGGIARALSPWVRTIAYCEIERYCQGILLSEMQRGRIDDAPIWDDVRTLRRDYFNAPVDIISGGFPCQDISLAGSGKGLEGERSGLVFEYLRLIGDLRPRYVFMENVPAVTIRGLDRVLMDLDALGYDARWTIVSAAEVGAPHVRERWWLLAHARDDRHRIESESLDERRGEGAPNPRGNGAKESLANSISNRSQGREAGEFCGEHQSKGPNPETSRGDCGTKWGWEIESTMGRVDNGTPFWGHRIKSLGNGVVPQCAREAFVRLSGMSEGGH